MWTHNGLPPKGARPLDAPAYWLSAARAGQRHTPRAASRGKKLTPTGFVATRLAQVQSAMRNDA